MAKVVKYTVYSSLDDYVYDRGVPVSGLYFPDHDNMILLIVNGAVVATFDFKVDDEVEIIKEVEVPEELITKAINLALANEKLSPEMDRISDLLKG